MKKRKKCSTIGGQAVLEGVMMRGKTSMATAVRDKDGIIRIETQRIKQTKERKLFFRLPIIRGCVAFFESLVGGTKTLMRSAEVFGEEEPTKFENWVSKKCKVDVMSVITAFSLIIGLFLAVFLFIYLPQRVRIWVLGDNPNVWAGNFLEGGIKLSVFILYILFCTIFKDIRNVFKYHGAEHKTISCYESGYELTVENAKKCSRVHDRCGTTFIVFVMVISIIIFACFEALCGNSIKNAISNVILYRIVRVLLRLLFLPIVAGLSYELLKGLAKTTCWVFYPLKVPGLLLQRLTTKEPNEKQLEVAITAFNKVMEMDENPDIKPVKFVTAVKRAKLTNEIIDKLKENGIEDVSDAEWIVALSLGIKRSEVYADRLVFPKDVDVINKLTEERVTGRPLWYCIGNADFMGYTLKVDERVLIPRPETELLVENALKEIKEDSEVLDLCSGSGAIAVAVFKKSQAKVTASDISVDAISLAEENAKSNDAQIEFIQSDLFENLNNRKFDVIISNPPYIKSEDINSLQKEVKDFEPILALDGGVDGLDFYRKIAKTAKKHVKKGGFLFLECGIGQANEIKEMFSKNAVEIIKDYNGIDRIVKVVF